LPSWGTQKSNRCKAQEEGHTISFVKAIQVEKEKLVWKAMAELESEKKKVGGLVITRAQKRKKVEKGADKRGKDGEQ